jgi:hypothetical protein
MPSSFRLIATRRQFAWAMIRIAMLILPLAWAWKHGGPDAYTAGWLISVYFIEIAISVVIGFIIERVRSRRRGG